MDETVPETAQTPSKATVLLVDDEPDVVKVTSCRLEQSGYRVLTASNGQQGVALAKAEHPDVILLDVMMPMMDGYQALRLLKDDTSTQDIPVVMLTARATERDMSASIEAGAVYHLTKPYQARELLMEVASALARHQRSHPPAA